ncbi:hypothetical protein L2E82_02151 [Cichorium intybus]|uniref:Uncharacterized protein n=1 Tax=Cichorium intybus TaxID=13427 RepID=A0ACB9H1M6_CICIN|nr:hypothetical protein L2E82_02151 [Cichorium intybus]
MKSSITSMISMLINMKNSSSDFRFFFLLLLVDCGIWELKQRIERVKEKSCKDRLFTSETEFSDEMMDSDRCFMSHYGRSEKYASVLSRGKGYDDGLINWGESSNYVNTNNFQVMSPLRNLVSATSKYDVYLMSNYSIMHWSSLSYKLTEILNFSSHVAPNEFAVLKKVEGISSETMLLLWSMKEKYDTNSKFKVYFDTLPEAFNTVEGIGQVVALDNDKASVEACRRNIKFNGSVASAKVETNLIDARVYMLTHPKEFDMVDLDPYGSPSVFLDFAVQSVADGGMLMCTATDMPVLCGGNGKVCYSKELTALHASSEKVTEWLNKNNPNNTPTQESRAAKSNQMGQSKFIAPAKLLLHSKIQIGSSPVTTTF